MGNVIDIKGSKKATPKAKAKTASEDERPPEVPGKCNVWITKRGVRCRRDAGAGTDHLGTGPCSNHLGNTPAARKHAHKEAAIEYARSIASEVEMDPVEALLWAVRLSAGSVSYWVEQMNRLGEETDPALAVAIEDAYGKERDRLAKTAAVCISVGLAERQVRIAERQGDLMAQVLEATLEHIGIRASEIVQAKQFAAKAMLALPVGQAVS